MDSLSHIATKQSTGNRKECRHSERAKGLARFYKQSMVLRIKELRKTKNWTQEELADRAGMSRSQLAMIEAETRPANTVRLNAIAAALGVQTKDLFGEGAEKQIVFDLLDQMSAEDRAAIVRMAEALAAKNTQK